MGYRPEAGWPPADSGLASSCLKLLWTGCQPREISPKILITFFKENRWQYWSSLTTWQQVTMWLLRGPVSSPRFLPSP